MKLRIFLILLLVSVIGCSDSTSPAPQAVETVVIPFEIIESGMQSGFHPDAPALTLIQDDVAWQAFWKTHKTITPIPAAPAVNFSNQMLIAVVDSDQPNSAYSLHLDRVEQHGSELWVYVTREQPATGCLNLGMVSQPFVLATLPKTAGIPKLVFSTHMYDC